MTSMVNLTEIYIPEYTPVYVYLNGRNRTMYYCVNPDTYPINKIDRDPMDFTRIFYRTYDTLQGTNRTMLYDSWCVYERDLP